jgi:hypothetical protein
MQPNPFDLARVNLTLLHRQPATAVPLHGSKDGISQVCPAGRADRLAAGARKLSTVTRQEGYVLWDR